MAEAAEVISSVDEVESNTSDTEEAMSTHSESQTTSDEEEVADAVYQFKITLKHIKPPIWRRILILNNSTFANLHTAVVRAMGWLDYHLHAFQKPGLEIAPADDEDYLDLKLDERKVKLWEHFKNPKDSFGYLYDFGDDWLHGIVLEKILPYDNRSYPICIAGKRACPPEDCGGVHGYANLLKVLSNPDDPEHEDMKEWMNGMGKENFDPEAFDPSSVDFSVLM